MLLFVDCIKISLFVLIKLPGLKFDEVAGGGRWRGEENTSAAVYVWLNDWIWLDLWMDATVWARQTAGGAKICGTEVSLYSAFYYVAKKAILVCLNHKCEWKRSNKQKLTSYESVAKADGGFWEELTQNCLLFSKDEALDRQLW